MPSNQLTAIAAVARNGVIGIGGRMPWHIPDDLRHFRDVTMGGALIMGRMTYESLGRPLVGRACVVISGHPVAVTIDDLIQLPDGLTTTVQWARTLDQALSLARSTGRPVFVAGGGQVYRSAWPLLTDLDLTLVDAEPLGDTDFPDIDPEDWVEVSRMPGDGYAFVRYRRRDALA